MNVFAVLGDPVRQRIVEVLAGGEMTSGDIVEQVGGAFHISQSAVSQQLKVLRDNGFARVRADGRRRFYALDPTPLMAVDAWVARYRTFWEDALSDLDVEIERGKADRRSRSN